MQDDTTFVYGFAFASVRLAVPRPWEKQIVSDLHKYLSKEVPATVVALIILPLILVLYQYRSAFRLSAVISAAYHLLSGNPHGSLFHPSRQGCFILLLSGVISLLIQYPTNLLKGLVVSSTQEVRISASNCSVQHCRMVTYRTPWFFKFPNESSVHITFQPYPQGAVLEENLSENCGDTAISVSGMVNSTKLAFLVAYSTLCDAADLLKFQLSEIKNKLVYELLPRSTVTQALCSRGVGYGGQVDHWSDVRIANKILEHGLMNFPHLNASIRMKNSDESQFWVGNFSQAHFENRVALQTNFDFIVAELEKLYEFYQMRGENALVKPLGQSELAPVLRVFAAIYMFVLGVHLTVVCWNRLGPQN